MNLSSPIRSVIPGAHGPVLAVLARTTHPLSGRQVAELTENRVSQTQVNTVLTELTRSGVVHRRDHPPAKLYLLNREHLAAPGVEALVGMRDELLRRLRELTNTWEVPAVAVWLFGSVARGTGDSTSDIDLLVVRPDRTDGEDAGWQEQLRAVSDLVLAWSGNACNAVVLSETELDQAAVRDERLVSELRRDALALAGASPHTLLRRTAVRSQP